MENLSLNYCEKSVKTCAGHHGHLTMSQIIFLNVVIDAIKMSMMFLFFAFFSPMSISSPTYSPSPLSQP